MKSKVLGRKVVIINGKEIEVRLIEAYRYRDGSPVIMPRARYYHRIKCPKCGKIL